MTTWPKKITKIPNILEFSIFEIMKIFGFLKFWKSLNFFKFVFFQTQHQTAILEFPKGMVWHPSLQSRRSDLIGDRVFIESRQNVIKMQAKQSDGSEGKISNPHKNLTKHHTCRANFVLARHNPQSLVAVNCEYCSKDVISIGNSSSILV